MAEAEGVSTQQIEETSDVQFDTAVQEKGIDVSHYQGKIDWGEVAKADIKHVCMKMSEGATYVDPTFEKNWESAKNAGIRVNCYHYFLALGCSAQEQMNNIKKNTEAVRFDPTKNILAIDVEKKGNEKATPAVMANKLKALLDLIKKDSVLSRCPVMIYTSYGYWNTNVTWDTSFADYPLWVAHWGTQSPRLPEPWKQEGKNWTWWQHSNTGKVSGIDTDVDLDWVRV